MDLPSVRAAMVQSNLDELDALGGGIAEKVRARLDAGQLAVTLEASRLAWLPVAHDIALAEAIDREIGRAAMRGWSKQGMLRIAESPLLAPIARSAKAIFGLTPSSFLRRAPQVWSLLYRDCGRMEMHAGDDPQRAEVHLVGTASEVTASRAYLVSLEGGIEAAMTLSGVEGRVTVDVQSEVVVFHCRW